MNMNLTDFVTNDVNIIEFYFCKDITNADEIDVNINSDI